MSRTSFPHGWDEERTRCLADHYEQLTEEELLAEDEAGASDGPEQSVVVVPTEMVPAIRELLAKQKAAS